MADENRGSLVSIPLEVEHFLASVFGGGTTGRAVVGHNREKEWKKWCRRLVGRLRKYLDANLVTDRTHRELIHEVIEEIEKAIRKPDCEREPRIVCGLVSLLFLILGDLPGHWFRKRAGRPRDFKLDRFRTLRYCQSPQQRSLLLFHTFVRPALDGKADRTIAERWEKLFWRCSKRNAHGEFVQQFRTERGREFLDLFG